MLFLLSNFEKSFLLSIIKTSSLNIFIFNIKKVLYIEFYIPVLVIKKI